MTENPTSSPSNPALPRWYTVVAALCVFLLALVVFLPTIRHQFVSFDDAENVYQNPYLNPVNEHTLPRFWSEPYNELYTPLTYTIWAAVAAVPATRLPEPVLVSVGKHTAYSAAPFHALGVALHGINAVLVFLLLARLPLLRGRAPLYAALGAMFWAIHPLQAESVAWVTGQNNVFSGTFMLLALLAFVRPFDSGKETTHFGWYLMATFFYVLALLAKPTAAALPLVAFALAFGAYRKSVRSLLFPVGAWLCLAAGLFLITRNSITPVTDVSLPLWQRPFIVGDAVAFYIQKILIPLRLGTDYGRQPQWLRTQTWFYAMWLVPVGIGGLLWVWHQRTVNKEFARTVLSGAAIFVLGALPMLGIVPYYFHRNSTVADRYLYVALIGVAILVASVLAMLPKRWQRIGVGVTGAAILVAALLSAQQAQVWRDSHTLYVHAVKVNPGSMSSHFNLASVYATEQMPDKALAELEQAAACRPEGASLPANVQLQLGNVLVQRSQYPQAIAAYEKGIALNGKIIEVRAQLISLLWQLGDKDKAQALKQETIQSAEDPIAAAYTIGNTLLEQRGQELGLPLLEGVARTTNEKAADASYVLALWYAKTGDDHRAVSYLQKALQLRPGWAPAQNALKELSAPQ